MGTVFPSSLSSILKTTIHRRYCTVVSLLKAGPLINLTPSEEEKEDCLLHRGSWEGALPTQSEEAPVSPKQLPDLVL